MNPIKRKAQFLPVLLLTILLLAAVMLAIRLQPQKPLLERLVIQDAAGQELAPYYDAQNGRSVLYLPAYVSPEDLRLSLPAGWVRGRLAENTLHITAWSTQGRESDVLTVITCEGLPSLFVQAEEGTRDYLHEDKLNEKEALLLLKDEAGKLVFSQVAKISGRGNSSWDNQAKRPYELKLDSGVTFGPFENARKLCLLAEHSDESKLRSSAAYFGARELGLEYATGYYYVNLYFEGQYLGLYGIANKESYANAIQSDGIRAVFEVTSNLAQQDFHPALSRNPVRVLYGSAEEVRSAVEAFEHALLAQDWTACTQTIDPESFARKFLLDELFANTDMGYASQFYYLDAGGRIHCMQPWDYDLSLGYTLRYYNNKQLYEIESYRYPQGWYTLLAAQPEFRQRLLALLEQECNQTFAQTLEDYLFQTAEIIAPSRECDILRWRSEKPFSYLDLSCGEETLEGMAALYADYVSQRIAFLKEHLAKWDTSCRIEFHGDQYANLVLPQGAKLWDYLEGARILRGEVFNPSFTGWATEEGLTPEQIDTVTGDIHFYASYQ